MADAGLQALAVPAPQAPQTLQKPAQQTQHNPHLIWSHFKPKLPGKPEEDAEAHLLRMNDWMDTHQFQEGVKVQRFCLTLVGESRLLYEPLRPINIDWQGLQNQFRQQYSKIGITREQLLYVWQSFHFDEKTKTTDSYVTGIRQVATLFSYGDPHILEVFKNTLFTKLCWVLFPIEDLRQVVETAKRILTKEKIDRWLADQLSSNPFMSIKDNYNNKKVIFDVQEGLGDKIDRLTVMMSKLAANKEGVNKQLKSLRYIKIKGEARQEISMTDVIIRIGTSWIVEIKEYNLVVEFNMNRIIEVD